MKIDRLNAMEQYVIKKETVSIDELCRVFDVSKNTIRRDLNELKARGRITKVYGGVTAVSQNSAAPILAQAALNQDSKEKIGRLAAEFVEDGDTIFVDSGSTAVWVLPYLADRRGVTVITHSLPAMAEAAKYDNLELLALGGIYDCDTGSFLGISSLENISTVNIHKAFMAATGVSIRGGVTNITYMESEVKKSVVSHTDKIILMADSTKVGKDAFASFCRLSDIYAFVTDRPLPEEYNQFLQKNDIIIKL